MADLDIESDGLRIHIEIDAEPALAALRAVEHELEAIVRDLHQRIATCHKRRACPTCAAPLGVLCRAMPIGWLSPSNQCGRVLKNPHEARWRQEIPKR